MTPDPSPPTVAEIIEAVLRREDPTLGLATRHAADRGGWTRIGVTAASWGQYAGLGRPATRAELDALSLAQIRQFYFDRHVLPFERVPEPLRALLVDWGVTSPMPRVWREVQTALIRQGAYQRPDGTAARVDGIPGPLTERGVLTVSDQRRLYRDVFMGRSQFYVAVAVRDPRIPATVREATNLAFAVGWNNRVLDFTPR